MPDSNAVLDFWFPPGLASDLDTHRRQWQTWMRGGMDAEISRRFTELSQRGARGELQDWVETARGRLALILVLDQFSRTVFRDSPQAYAQDERAIEVCETGLSCGHYAELTTPWEKTFFAMPLAHGEGPKAPARSRRGLALARELIEQAPASLRPMYEFAAEQSRLHAGVLSTFGRHPHRNALLNRTSTPEELEYLARGTFPHERPIEDL